MFTCKGCTALGDGFGERSGRAEADGGRHDGEGCRTAI